MGFAYKMSVYGGDRNKKRKVCKRRGTFTCTISLSDFAVRCHLKRNYPAQIFLHRNLKMRFFTFFTVKKCKESHFKNCDAERFEQDNCFSNHIGLQNWTMKSDM